MRLLTALLFVIVSYNVENLFHPSCDSVNTDSTFTTEGERHWTYRRYYSKEENIARVLTNIGRWDGVDVVGLQEVEDALVLRRLCRTLRPNEYDYVHYDSPDRRGIDVALVYRKARLDTLRTRPIPVPLQSAEGEISTTRDILYVCGVADKRDTLHFFVCHLPSQLGGAAESEWKRMAAKRVLQQAVDSVRKDNPAAKIIVMGDMNSGPKDDIQGLRNRMTDDVFKGKGTHKHQGRWTCLDQFYVSPALDSLSSVRIYEAEWLMEPDEKYLGLTPKRCYKGLRYQDGFSDHLPVILDIKRE
jgi:endonuclease/exonuclease/phosphatase family metal-dependent hydrolase